VIKIGKIIIQLMVLYIFYLIGSYVQYTFNLFIPGSVIGLILLFTLLVTNIINVSWVEDGAKFMVNHLVLFFIPPTVGIMHYFNLFAGKGLLLVVVTIISTVIVIGCSGSISQLFYKRKMPNE